MGEKMNNLPKRQFWGIIIFLLSATVFILGWFGYIMLIKEPLPVIKPVNQSFKRGKILDRNGHILADELSLYNIIISPPKDRNEERKLDKIDSIASNLAPFLEMDADIIKEEILKNNQQFYIKENVPSETYLKIEAARKNNIIYGVTSRETRPKRIYPNADLAKHLIGNVRTDYLGNSGVEFAFDKVLREKPNGDSVTNVVLTIDINIQRILENTASSYMKKYDAASAVLIAIDPRTGDILGAALKKTPGRKTIDPFLPHNQYEPGSVLKAFTMAAVLDSGAVTENTEFFCNGIYDKLPSPIRCLAPHGTVKIRDIIVKSCNVGAATASEYIDIDKLYDYIEKFGFNKKTGAWLNESSEKTTRNGSAVIEAKGWLNKPGTEKYSVRTKPSVAFGQEIGVTTLQIIQAATAIANKGILVPIRYIARFESPDGTIIKDFKDNYKSGIKVIEPLTASKMLSFMKDAVVSGTGAKAEIDGYSVAVKTGTAQIPVGGGGKEAYSEVDFISSCIAILPAENPSLVLYAAIDSPRGETYGSIIAAPAIKEAAEEIISYVGIPPGFYVDGYLTGDNIVNHSGVITVREVKLPEMTTVVPSFVGLPKKILTPLLNRNDVKVELRGNGWVTRQSPPAGTALTTGMVLELILE